jgi:hypothetical protein
MSFQAIRVRRRVQLAIESARAETLSAPSGTFHERRPAVRVVVNVEVHYGTDGTTKTPGHVTEISRTGLRLQTDDRPLFIGSEIDIVFGRSFPASGLRVKGKVVRTASPLEFALTIVGDNETKLALAAACSRSAWPTERYVATHKHAQAPE